MARLRRGDLPPRMIQPPPGPRSRELAARLAAWEAPGVNTLPGGDPAAAAPAWAEARGANVLDLDGNRYVDLTSGFGAAAVGHRHPRVTAAIRRQSGRLVHGLGDVHPHPLRARLAARLCERAPVDEPRVHFGISGAEAVEIALQTALAVTGRTAVLAFEPAYHGLTLGALAVTSRESFRRPFTAWLGIPVVRLPHGGDPAAAGRRLRERSDVGAVIFEPVVGREGVLLPPPGWLAAIAAEARRHGALVIADEIFTGFGRTGEWFGVDAEGVRPDLLVCGKALGGGLPLAAVIGRRSLLAGAWSTPGEALHTATFVAHPLACAAALAALDVLERDDLPGRAHRLGAWMERRMRPWRGRFAGVRDVRGRGLLWAVELAAKALAKSVAAGLLERGVLALAGGAEGRVLQIVPPLTIGERQLAAALDLLEQTLEQTCGKISEPTLEDAAP
jgi:4-aminobutyrate aminotransferase-like enzyme